MSVAGDASPLIVLAKVDLLPLLNALYTEVKTGAEAPRQGRKEEGIDPSHTSKANGHRSEWCARSSKLKPRKGYQRKQTKRLIEKAGQS